MKNAQLARIVGLAAWSAVTLTASPVQDAVRAYRTAHEQELMSEYREFVRLPCVGADQPNVRRNAEFIVAMMKRRGIAAELLEGRTGATNPAVFGEIKVPGATRTVVFYAHYDGQPVNPKEWAEGLDPWNPVFLTAPVARGGRVVTDWKPGDAINPEWRLNGRASADDKAGVFSILNGYDALVKTGGRPTVNVKFFFEGEEEMGSPNLGELLELHRAKLQSDLWIICDGPRPVSGRKSVVFGVRGDVNMDLTVYGAKRPLHSGNYGNFAPNPALRLVSLIASMKDDKGRVLIKGFYDDYVMFSESERIAIKDAGSTDAFLLQDLGLKEPEVPGRSLLEGFELPTLNINGFTSANTGRTATNVIPAVARATLDLRLVLGIDWRLQTGRVIAHMKEQGWLVLDREPTDADRAQSAKLVKVEVGSGYNAQRTLMNLPLAQAVVAAVQSTTAEPVVRLPTAGGSLPLVIIEEMLGAKVISVPAVNYDNNQHAENENMLIRYLWEGMETFAALMTMP
ncbi:MAG: M20/M25/M40 family metallo-hydrolase [Opitutae bacterium]|nr:M20/M25/M40 family metallo-hydrolase [Opitutae bacterium]